ncbi:MAG: hypothetical protein R6X10_03090, partial [Desulfobacterales bacterium]
TAHVFRGRGKKRRFRIYPGNHSKPISLLLFFQNGWKNQYEAFSCHPPQHHFTFFFKLFRELQR